MPARRLLRRLKDISPWLPSYLGDSSGRARRRRRLEYLILCFVDHFEPSWNHVSEHEATARVKRWTDAYPKIAATIYDCTGRTLPHSWFYPFDEARPAELGALSELVFDGWGEIDLHLHHFHDTAEGLRQKLKDAVSLYGRYGALRDITGQPSFGFIHGNWALGNTMPEFCGVEDELPILRESGCFGDFTFPAPNRCQPRVVNRIYAASERGSRPIEYGSDLRVFPSPTLPIVQGPIRVAPIGGRWRIDDGEVDAHNVFLLERLRAWSRAAITVRPQATWGFVKIFTHGAPERSADAILDQFLPLLPDAIDRVGLPVVFATAREFLNMAYAAAAGREGNPADYRDAFIPPPLGRHAWAEGGAAIDVVTEHALKLTDIGRGKVKLAYESGSSVSVSGDVQSLSWDQSLLKLQCKGEVNVGGSISAPAVIKGTGDTGRYQPTDKGEVWLRW